MNTLWLRVGCNSTAVNNNDRVIEQHYTKTSSISLYIVLRHFKNHSCSNLSLKCKALPFSQQIREKGGVAYYPKMGALKYPHLEENKIGGGYNNIGGGRDDNPQKTLGDNFFTGALTYLPHKSVFLSRISCEQFSFQSWN